MLNRELSRGWGAWVEMAVERAEFMRLLRKGGAFMFNQSLAMGMRKAYAHYASAFS